MTAIDQPGEHQLTKQQYELDPCETPSLRSSIAWLLASKTPAHARHQSPRLNPKYRRVEKKHFDVGSVAHALLLGKGTEYRVIDAPNYKLKKHQAERDRVYALGMTPIAAPAFDQIKAMVAAVRRQFADLVDYGAIETEPFTHNETERCIIWREDNGVWCRAALDGLSLDGDILSEFKTEGETANFDAWRWKARKMGYFFKVCFYMRGLSKLGIAHSPAARFFVAETEEPHLLSWVRLDDELAMRETQRVEQAIKLWGRCLEQDRWPGYSPEGYDATLTERERQAEAVGGAGLPNGGHLSSDDIAASL